MAGIPKQILDNATQILNQLESFRREKGKKEQFIENKNEMQLSFVQLDDPILEDIRDKILELNIDQLTPVEALMKLHEIKKLIGK